MVVYVIHRSQKCLYCTKAVKLRKSKPVREFRVYLLDCRVYLIELFDIYILFNRQQ